MWAGLSVTTFISIVTTSNEHEKLEMCSVSTNGEQASQAIA